jgi:rhodanese-related sulfurtransferase
MSFLAHRALLLRRHEVRTMDRRGAGLDCRRDNPVTMDQPHKYAALGSEPVLTISRDELKAKLDRGEDVKLIMALNRWAFDAKHIPGSLHFDSPDELYAAVRPSDEIVVYCSHVDCLSSVALYRDLVRRGYRNVRRYAGGLLDWEEAGLPLEGEFGSDS